MDQTGFSTALPSHGVPSFIADLAPSLPSTICGKTVRIVGRVVHYDALSNLALLTEPYKPETLLVDTRLTDSWDFRPGSLVMVIGELGIGTEPRGGERISQHCHHNHHHHHQQQQQQQQQQPYEDTSSSMNSNSNNNNNNNSYKKSATMKASQDLTDAVKGVIDKHAADETDIGPKKDGLVLTARVSQCVDRLDYSQYCCAVRVWRDFSHGDTLGSPKP